MAVNMIDDGPGQRCIHIARRGKLVDVRVCPHARMGICSGRPPPSGERSLGQPGAVAFQFNFQRSKCNNMLAQCCPFAADDHCMKNPLAGRGPPPAREPVRHTRIFVSQPDRSRGRRMDYAARTRVMRALWRVHSLRARESITNVFQFACCILCSVFVYSLSLSTCLSKGSRPSSRVCLHETRQTRYTCCAKAF